MARYNFMGRERKNATTAVSETYVRKQTEILEVAMYRYGSPTKVEPTKNSRVTDDNWRSTSNPVRDPLPKVGDFPTEIKTEDPWPTRPGLFRAPNWRNPPNSIGQGTTNNREDAGNHKNRDRYKPNGNTMQDESYTEPHITNNNRREDHGRKGLTTLPPQPNYPLPGATTEVSRPTWPGLLRATNWRNPLNSEEEGRTTNNRGYPNNNDRNKPNGNTIQDKRLPPPNGQLSGPTNDIGEPEETIDSKEAAKRYGKLNPSTRPLQTEGSYTGIIDSEEAARKYKGVVLPIGQTGGIIDSGEAARKYKGVVLPIGQTGGIIDSEEAARKYKGVVLPIEQTGGIIDSEEAARKYKGVVLPIEQTGRIIDSKKAAQKYNGVEF